MSQNLDLKEKSSLHDILLRSSLDKKVLLNLRLKAIVDREIEGKNSLEDLVQVFCHLVYLLYVKMSIFFPLVRRPEPKIVDFPLRDDSAQADFSVESVLSSPTERETLSVSLDATVSEEDSVLNSDAWREFFALMEKNAPWEEYVILHPLSLAKRRFADHRIFSNDYLRQIYFLLSAFNRKEQRIVYDVEKKIDLDMFLQRLRAFFEKREESVFFDDLASWLSEDRLGRIYLFTALLQAHAQSWLVLTQEESYGRILVSKR